MLAVRGEIRLVNRIFGVISALYATRVQRGDKASQEWQFSMLSSLIINKIMRYSCDSERICRLFDEKPLFLQSMMSQTKSKHIKLINEFIDSHETELLELWGKAQRGERITKIVR